MWRALRFRHPRLPPLRLGSQSLLFQWWMLLGRARYLIFRCECSTCEAVATKFRLGASWLERDDLKDTNTTITSAELGSALDTHPRCLSPS